MKRFYKISTVLLVLCMILSLVPAAFAAEYTGNPAQTVTVSFKVENIMGIDGNVAVEDPDGIVASSEIKSVTTAMSGDFNNREIYYYSGDLSLCTFELVYEVTLKADAPQGASCDIIFTYEVTDADYNLSDWIAKSHTINVEIPATEPSATEPPATEPPATEPPATEPPATEPPATEPPATEPKPTEPTVVIDYTQLNEQLDIYGKLNSADYTAESWEAIEKALKEAEEAKKSGDQAAIDAAAAALKKAIEGLVALDYSKLQAAIESVETFLTDDSIGSKAQELIATLETAKALLESKDQAAIDEGAALLTQLLEELQKAITDMTKVEEIIKEIEKIVEVEPTDPYCNISIHYVWPILFFISLALNVGFVVLIVVYFVRKKKETDDTPLVEYDIDEDEV